MWDNKFVCVCVNERVSAWHITLAGRHVQAVSGPTGPAVPL